MAKDVQSIKHKKDKRIHIPSIEEAGYEDANILVKDGRKFIEIPKNPVVHRGQDPELFWLNKYGNDDREDLLQVDIRSLYRHEHIAPETLIRNLYKVTESPTNQVDLFNVNELFGNSLEKDELDKVSDYYQHQDGWTNRLIQGDSHLVMASLLEREGMAGQVQTIFFDPPYGIKYGGNWQIKLNSRNIIDGNDEALTGEPEQIKAFRDTWELGIHSYLTYLRDRLVIAKELLNDSGSCFVQISDENMHLVRNLLDEVFGSECFISSIKFKTTTARTSKFLSQISDYILWYGKDVEKTKYRQLFVEKSSDSSHFDKIDSNGNPYYLRDLSSQGEGRNTPFLFNGKNYIPPKGRHWSVDVSKLPNDRIEVAGNYIRGKVYQKDFPVSPLPDIWDDTQFGGSKVYVVQTNEKVIQRCILMTTDPGDLVLDPTCGSGTTAYVAEQWGRRWLTIDTSRIALNIAKQRLMTAVFPYYDLYDEQGEDIRQGFKYKTVPHITLKSLANDEPPSTETLYDQPSIDKKKLRVCGPFTVETLQNYNPISPEELEFEKRNDDDIDSFENVIKNHLESAGIKNGRKNEMVRFRSIDSLSGEALHAEGYYSSDKGEEKAYFHIGPKFGTVSKRLVSDAVKECRQKGDANWLVILGFSFESDIEGGAQTTSMGTFEVTKARIHDDLLQEGLKKKPAKSAASFVTIGEPDIELIKKGIDVQVKIKGLDIYDPIKDEVKARNVNEIAYWMVDDDYDGSNFVVKQIFFCGGEKDAFNKWRKGLDTLAKAKTKRKVEKTLKIEIDDDAFDRLYGHISHPIKVKSENQRIAVKIISQFGEESTKVLAIY
jgi:adenine-specific DNA-methyltransferase